MSSNIISFNTNLFSIFVAGSSLSICFAESYNFNLDISNCDTIKCTYTATRCSILVTNLVTQLLNKRLTNAKSSPMPLCYTKSSDSFQVHLRTVAFV